MPDRDAKKLVSIAQQHLPQEKVKDFILHLDKDIGGTTENSWMKEVLMAARLIVDPPPLAAPFYLWAAFYTLVVAHILLVIGIVISFFLLPFLAPWYIALPVMVFIWFFSTTKVECKLTNLENVLRRRLGLRRIGGFVGHYFLKPARWALTRLSQWEWRRNRRKA